MCAVLLLENAVTGTVLILMVILLRRMFKQYLPPTTWLAMWGLCLFRLLSPVIPESRFSIYNLLHQTTNGGIVQEASVNLEMAGQTAAVSSGVQSAQIEHGLIQTSEASVSAAGVICAVYLIGAICTFAWFVWGWIQTLRLVHGAKPINRDGACTTSQCRFVQIRMSESAGKSGPFTFGVFRPVIVLPPNLSDRAFELVLMHEEIHAKRRDNLWNYAMAIALIVHWWNPMVWFMRRYLQMDIEKSCDRAVITKLRGNCRREYAQLLVTLSTRGKGPAFSRRFGQNKAKERIVSIMKYKKMRIPAILLSVALIVSMSFIFVANAIDLENITDGTVETDNAAEAEDGAENEGVALADIPDAPSGDDVLISLADGEESDVEGVLDLDDSDASITNVNITNRTFTLGKGESKTFSFNVSGGLFAGDHNAVSVVITDNSGGSYQYISENVTRGRELANIKLSGSAKRVLSNLDPDAKYEITFINLGTSDLSLTVSITSYIK